MKSIKWNGKELFPSKIICVGRNYVDHIKELANEVPDEPVIFLKPNSSISSEIHSCVVDALHYEGEITFLITNDELQGVGFGIDLTKRELQTELKKKGLPWERAKSFDNSATFSEFVSFNCDISEIRMELLINNCLVQAGGCELMLNQPQQILDEVKSFISFEDGDLLMCGTPKGVGPVHSGDQFTGRIFDKEKLLVEAYWQAN
ncbi:MAG: 2-keto-4-pentenoate hydratase [marine bacterium B5-7]|nr:MAG: 2-keto-4-pentenoate hydratase [marine bacterium B5-7]